MKDYLQKKHTLLTTIMLLLVSFALMSAFLYGFSNNVNNNQTQLAKERLKEVVTQNVAFVNLMVNDKVTYLDGLAKDLSQFNDLKSKQIVIYMHAACAKTDFERISVDFLNGESYTSDGNIEDITDLGYLDEIKKGKTFITDLTISKIDNKPCVSIISPIMRNGVVVAAARGTIYTQKFGQVLNVDFFEGQGYFHLLNGAGEYLALPTNDNAFLMDENYFDAIEKLNFDSGYSSEQIKTHMKNGAGGNTAYSFDGMERYAEYMPVGINDWYLMIITPKWVIDKNSNMIRKQMLSLVIKLTLIFLVIFLFILFAAKRSRDEIKKVNEKLQVEEKRYRFMLERSDNIIFEYTLSDGAIEYSEKFVAVFGFAPTSLGLPFSVIKSGGVHAEDAKNMLHLFTDVKSGKPNSKTEMRIRHANGNYIWCSVVTVTIFNEDHVPIKAFGVIENIDKQKQREMALIAKAEKDQLTGLYNKATTEGLIKDFLSNSNSLSSTHALIIIDVDDFKLVNDKLGHLHGDLVLTELAHKLKQATRSGDIVGRIGGDEFFMFIKNMSGDDVAIFKAIEICNLFRKNYAEGDACCSISASIGIAVFPRHGRDFKTLYKNADSALYVAKAGGKDSCSLYDGETASPQSHNGAQQHK